MAHPIAHGGSDKGFMRMGPDIMPYSEVQYKDALNSPYILGLQGWNEDVDLSTRVSTLYTSDFTNENHFVFVLSIFLPSSFSSSSTRVPWNWAPFRSVTRTFLPAVIPLVSPGACLW